MEAPDRLPTPARTPRPRVRRSRVAASARVWCATLACALAWCPLARSQTAPPAAGDAAHQQFVFAYRLLQRGEWNPAAEAFDDYLGRFPEAPRRGDALYFRAELARRAGDHAKAASLLTTVPAPTLVEAHAVDLLRGQVALTLGRHDDAIAALERVKPAGLDKETHARLLYLQGLAYRGANNLGAAERQLQAAHQLGTPLAGRVLLDLARVQASAGQHAKAVQSLDRALAMKDAQVEPEAAHLAGDLCFRASDFLKAIPYYQAVATAHQSTEHFTPCVIALLWSRHRAGQHEPLLADHRRYVNSLPATERPSAWYLAGLAHQALGRTQEAAQLLESAVDAGSSRGFEDHALLSLAQCRADLNQREALEATVARLQREHPRSAHISSVQLLLATHEAKAGEAAKAVERLAAVIQAGPDSPGYSGALIQRSLLSESAGQWEAALADLQALLALPSQGPRALSAGQRDATLLRVSAAQLTLKRPAEALAAADAVLAQPDRPAAIEAEALYRRAMAQVKLQKFDEALTSLDKLLSRHPQNPYRHESMYYRGMLLMAQRRTDDAVQQLESVAKEPDMPGALRGKALRLLSRHHREAGADDRSAATLLQLEKEKGGLSYSEQLWLGRHYASKGDPPRALEYLLRVLKARDQVLPQELAEARLLAGLALRELGTPEARKDALDAFREVVAMGKGFELQARLETGRTLLSLGQHRAALDEFEPLFTRQETRVAAAAIYEAGRAHHAIARDRARSDNSAGAAESLREAALLWRRLVVLYHHPQLAPLPQRAYLDLAELAEDRKDPQAARVEYEHLAQRYPTGPHSIYAKACIAWIDGKTAEARHLLESLKKSDPTPDADLLDRVNRRLQQLEGRR